MAEDKKIILFDIDHTLFDTDTFFESQLTDFRLYEEVHEVLKELAQVATLGIFSQGDVVFQKKKLIETNIKKYFLEEHTHVGPDKNEMIKTLLERYRGKGEIFFVEDRLPFLLTVRQYEPSIITVWIKRGFFAKQQEPIPDFSPDHTINNLRELVPLVAKSK